MAKATLLEIVQDILSAMDSDNVNSITDTIEAEQVADIVKREYYDLVVEQDYDSFETIFQLVGSGSSTKPTRMTFPDNTMKVLSVKYDRRTSVSGPDSFTEITYLSPLEFTNLVDGRDSTASNVLVHVENGINFNIINDIPPTYYTVLGDDVVLFDSYDASVDVSLQDNKSKCIGMKEPTWVHTDTAVPSLSWQLFPLLIARAKRASFDLVKQQPSLTAERAAKKIEIALKRKQKKSYAARLIPGDKINYGRK